MSRIVLLAQDDSAAECLGPLAAKGCKVLGITGADGSSCPIFARRCVELGFNFASTQDREMLDAVLDKFRPELLFCVPDLGAPAVSAFVDELKVDGLKKYVVRAGLKMSGAPWPEFAPIWLAQKTSRVAVVQRLADGEKEVASSLVSVGECETAITLRTKHAEEAAKLITVIISGGDLTVAEAVADADKDVRSQAGVCGEEAPANISISWNEATVGRYVRAHLLPPHDPAVVVDPGKDESYFVENLEQWMEFKTKVLGSGASGDADVASRSYAADTHWYSNVGGSIIKMGDSDVHMPAKCKDKKRKAIIPGAAMGARKKLRMNEPLIGPNAERYCSNALSSGWIGVEGPYVKQFEKDLARICGASACCAVQSGTAALYGAMKALGVSDASHHVLVPAFTCAACADAVVHAGGRPIPIDCDLESYGITAEAVRSALAGNKSVVGVVVAPCYGVPARDFMEIHAICKEKGIWLCEDAAESYGAYKSTPEGKFPVGALATLACISTRSEKMIGVGEGGAILGNDTTLVSRAKWWCSRAPCRGVGLWRVYDHDAVGQNFRMPEMLAAVGCAASEMLPTMIERKRNIHSWYEAGFAAHPTLNDIRLQKASAGDESVWWINAALLPEGWSGEEVGMQLMKLYPDIEIRPGFYPLNIMDIFKSKLSVPCPNAEILYKRLVCLPSSNQLQKEDIDRVCSALIDAMGAVTEKSCGSK